MTQAEPIEVLFLDIGGVLLTNGWDHTMRHKAAQTFDLDYEEINERHHLTFDTYEEGKLSLYEYLQRVIFFQERAFSLEEFKAFMFDQSRPYPQMIELIKGLKKRYDLRTAAVSNEGRELTVFRIEKYDLHAVIDFFVSSCFVHYRKPDEDMYRVALDIAQVSPGQAAYVDDRPMFVDVARGLGIHGVLHKDVATTRESLDALGLSVG